MLSIDEWHLEIFSVSPSLSSKRLPISNRDSLTFSIKHQFLAVWWTVLLPNLVHLTSNAKLAMPIYTGQILGKWRWTLKFRVWMFGGLWLSSGSKWLQAFGIPNIGANIHQNSVWNCLKMSQVLSKCLPLVLAIGRTSCLIENFNLKFVFHRLLRFLKIWKIWNSL